MKRDKRAEAGDKQSNRLSVKSHKGASQQRGQTGKSAGYRRYRRGIEGATRWAQEDIGIHIGTWGIGRDMGEGLGAWAIGGVIGGVRRHRCMARGMGTQWAYEGQRVQRGHGMGHEVHKRA